MLDDTNIQLLLTKLPSDSIARKLVLPFAALSLDDATRAAQAVLAAAKDAHLKKDDDGPVEAA